APDSPVIPFAFIAIEQDQGVDHLLGFMRTLAGYRFQFLPLLFLQRYLIAFHLLILPFRLRQEGKLSCYMRQFIRDRTLEPFSHFPIRTAAATLLQDKARQAPCSSAA